MARIEKDLTDARIDALIDFAPGGDGAPPLYGIYWDKREPGLRLYLGKRKVTWQFFAQSRDHGEREHKFETLGRYDRGSRLSGVGGGAAIPAEPSGRKRRPAVYTGPEPLLTRADWHMGVEAARLAAKVQRAQLIEGTAPPNKRAGIKFAETFEAYCDYLERKAHEAGKPPRWAANVRALGRIILPKWGGWTLYDLSHAPDQMADWHQEIAKKHGGTSANHIARIIRAVYRRQAKRDPTRKLSLADAPTSAVKLAKVKPEQKGLAAADFPAWYAALQAIKSPVHQGYHLANLLTGARPGEIGKVRWRDFDAKAHTLTLGDLKMGNSIDIPTTPEIEAALKLGKAGKPGDLIFPGCLINMCRDGLPVRGHALRRTWKTIATDHCGVSDEISCFLMGHIPPGMSVHYLLKFARVSGPKIIEAQAEVSRAITALLHGKPVAARVKRKRAA